MNDERLIEHLDALLAQITDREGGAPLPSRDAAEWAGIVATARCRLVELAVDCPGCDERDRIIIGRDNEIGDLHVRRQQTEADVAMVLTVYDEHVAPENRGPWRDRLAAAGATAPETTPAAGWVRGEDCRSPLCGSADECRSHGCSWGSGVAETTP